MLLWLSITIYSQTSIKNLPIDPWDQVKQVYLDKNYVYAITQLEKFIQQYPASPHYLEAVWLLADSYNVQKKFPEAIEKFQHYQKLIPSSEEKEKAAVAVAKAFSELKNWTHVLITLAHLPKKNLDVLFLKTQAFIQKNELKKATSYLDFMKSTYPDTAETARLALQLQLKLCFQPFKNSQPFDEMTLRSVMQTLSQCIVQAMGYLQKNYLYPFPETACQESLTSLKSYVDLLKNPPLKKLSNKNLQKKSQQEWSTFLIKHLHPDLITMTMSLQSLLKQSPQDACLKSIEHLLSSLQ